jgi:hypothetical protein
MKFKNFILSFMLIIPILATAQQIIYSEPRKSNPNPNDVEIIGKIEDNFLTYTLVKNKYQLQIYDAAELKLKDKVNLDFIPHETYKINFISYPNSLLVIFQCRAKKLLYSNVARLNKEGKLLGKIVAVDSVKAGAYNGSEIYAVTTSENKKHILFNRCLLGLKPNALQVEQLIVPEDLKTNKKDKYFIPYFSDKESISDLKLDDEGNVVFITYSKDSNNNSKVNFYKAPYISTELEIKDMAINNCTLTLPRIKINNNTGSYYLTSFYENPEHPDVQGLLSIILNKNLADYQLPLTFPFTDSLNYINGNRVEKSNLLTYNYFIKDIRIKEDGSFLVTGELNKRVANTTYSTMPSANSLITAYTPFGNQAIVPRIINDKVTLEAVDLRDYPGHDFSTRQIPTYSIDRKKNYDNSTPHYENAPSQYNVNSDSSGNVIVFSIDKYNRLVSVNSPGH